MSRPIKSPEGRRDAILAVRVPPAIKERIEKAAATRGWGLTDTVIELIRRGFKYAPDLGDPLEERPVFTGLSKPAQCHPDRPTYAGDLCATCFHSVPTN